ncbi:hypothetical protein Tther_00258 [Tepidimonas thermarum]|uniref:DUF6969 domain-containing protein n=1 Tax=Tepidimonas thermarum TaxID=335431 RepID=A0A554X8A1_9BURK|nr:hypothetical protein [Tepidimonas thermarum]TSE32055.1 hypothetical protein Tther_00258 [Tepidimonas thermarum]
MRLAATPANEPAHPGDPAAWAEVALRVPLTYAQRGVSLAQAALAGARDFQALRHYPARDVVDAAHGTRFYYHAHGGTQRWGAEAPPEHGHFHLFWDGSAPGTHVHLAALALDARGQPLRWFTTNRWVTAGRWAAADELIARLPRFRIAARGGRLAPLARWLTAMVQLFADEIAALLRARDAALAPHLRHRPAEDVLEDRSLEVLSAADAALAPHLQRLGLA